MKNKKKKTNVWMVQMRGLAKNKESPPEGFMCPGGWKVLVEYYESLVPASSNGRLPEPEPVLA